MLMQVSLLMIILFVIESLLLLNLMKKKKKKLFPLNKSSLENNISSVNIYAIDGKKQDLIDVLDEESYVFFIDRECKSCKEMMEVVLKIKPAHLRKVIFLTTKNENDFRYETDLKKNHGINIYTISENDLYDKLNVTSFPLFVKLKDKKTVSDIGYLSKYNVTNYIS